jgi:hypothetical protein
MRIMALTLVEDVPAIILNESKYTAPGKLTVVINNKY